MILLHHKMSLAVQPKAKAVKKVVKSKKDLTTF